MKIFLDDHCLYWYGHTPIQAKTMIIRMQGIYLDLEKCIFMVFLGMILGFMVSKEGKLLDPTKI